MEGFLKEKLQERKDRGLLRSLSPQSERVDFLSNDYLGLARNVELHQQITERINAMGFVDNGGTGSRLLSGNHEAYYRLEAFLRNLFRSEASLVFNSGYAANQGLISCVAGKGDSILYDQLSHVCIKEGAWLSKAQCFSFRHNDLGDLEQKLLKSRGRVFVVTESVFSMDGDEAPLESIIALCKKHNALLIVDEAHSTGTFGSGGSGWLCDRNLEQDVFARVYTFGKGMGVHGACVVGSQYLISYLINYGRSFIYTTSLPPHSVISIEESFRFLESHPELQSELSSKVELFKSRVKTESNTAIQPVIIPGNREVRSAAEQLRKLEFDVRPIVAPTVKEGTERLRLCLHAFNSEEEIMTLSKEINTLIK